MGSPFPGTPWKGSVGRTKATNRTPKNNEADLNIDGFCFKTYVNGPPILLFWGELVSRRTRPPSRVTETLCRAWVTAQHVRSPRPRPTEAPLEGGPPLLPPQPPHKEPVRPGGIGGPNRAGPGTQCRGSTACS